MRQNLKKWIVSFRRILDIANIDYFISDGKETKSKIDKSKAKNANWADWRTGLLNKHNLESLSN